MALSKPAPRKLLHTRTIQCNGYEREDGLFDIEGHMTDVKAYSFGNNRFRGQVSAGEPIHDMWIRITIDDELTIHDAEAITATGPYERCPQINDNYRRLIGLRIGAGWRREIKKRLGGIQGCTHLTELIGPLATTAFQTTVSKRRQKLEQQVEQNKRPMLLESCHAYARDSEVVKTYWPQFYQAVESEAAGDD